MKSSFKKFICVIAGVVVGLNSSTFALANDGKYVAHSSLERSYFHPDNYQYKKDLAALRSERAKLYCALQDGQELDTSKIDQITLRDADENETLRFFEEDGSFKEKQEELSMRWFFTDGKLPLACRFISKIQNIMPLENEEAMGRSIGVYVIGSNVLALGAAVATGSAAALAAPLAIPLAGLCTLVPVTYSILKMCRETGQADVRHIGYKNGVNRLKNGDQNVVKTSIPTNDKLFHQIFTYVPCKEKPKNIGIKTRQKASQEKNAQLSRPEMTQRHDPTIVNLYYLPQSEGPASTELARPSNVVNESMEEVNDLAEAVTSREHELSEQEYIEAVRQQLLYYPNAPQWFPSLDSNDQENNRKPKAKSKNPRLVPAS